VTDQERLAERLARIEERVRYLEVNPTLPGGEWEYREALREWVRTDTRLDALRRAMGGGQ
jgi:hypothetical protein